MVQSELRAHQGWLSMPRGLLNWLITCLSGFQNKAPELSSHQSAPQAVLLYKPFPRSSPGGSRVSKVGTESVRKDLFTQRYKEKLGKNSVVGKLVEKSCWITWFMWKANKSLKTRKLHHLQRPLVPAWIPEGARGCPALGSLSRGS